MKNYITHEEWSVREDRFYPEYNEITESLMSLGNGRMGHRGNFEEQYSGKTLQGSYLAGVYFPDKTRVGWWKNGYPDYFAKVLNACNWIGIDIKIGSEVLDLHTCVVEEFSRELNMKTGVLSRRVIASLPTGRRVKIESQRFLSLVEDDIGAIRYGITLLDFDDRVEIQPYLDGNIRNRDANYDELFWQEIKKETSFASGLLLLETKPNSYGVEQFQAATGMAFDLKIQDIRVDFQSLPIKKDRYVAGLVSIELKGDTELVVYKYAANVTSLHCASDALMDQAKISLADAVRKGFDRLLSEHQQAWAEKWESNDIVIEGDIAAQQGIRFNIFQLEQTYTGKDERFNIGPKGFTGEKYGGSTYWDTEAYCLPFYLSTAGQHVARNLLIYRHNHLGKAIENAKKLGFTGGAALYPMVTMNGEECHNEWEITFEEIHRNGAIAYAIHDYIRYTGDIDYLADYGLDVLIGLSRFWKQRTSWSEEQQKFVILGVTGPNEYENNVNNNWYTNYIARWTLQYTITAVEDTIGRDPQRWQQIADNLNFDAVVEMENWDRIVKQMYFPFDNSRGVFLQQQGFLDKELLTVDQIKNELPINQNWSWDRILRSCFIKQADVLQGLYFFEEDFDLDTIRRNFEFYEPMTVHESSLSPCVHAILAARLGLREKAYEMYLRTARLDLDDYNNDTADGLHITSMAGTWMSIIKGFAGLRITEAGLSLDPYVPQGWNAYSFRIGIRGVRLKVTVSGDGVEISSSSDVAFEISVHGRLTTVTSTDS